MSSVAKIDSFNAAQAYTGNLYKLLINVTHTNFKN